MFDRSTSRAGPSAPSSGGDGDDVDDAHTDRGRRAVSPLVGVLVLVALTVVLATVVAVGASTWSLEAGGPTAAFDLTVDGESSTVSVDHVAGDSLDVDELSVTIAVNGEALVRQPPVPFAGAPGFDGAPDGPFNSATDGEWRTGERASLTVAGTNDPGIESGDTVTVTLSVGGTRVSTLEATAA